MKVLSAHQLQSLMDRFVELTQEGKLTWEAEDDFTFKTTVGDTSFFITSDDDDDRHPYSAEISWKGNPVQRVNTVVRKGAVTGTELNQRLDKVYAAAKRQALDLDTVVNNIFADLGTEVPPEEPPDAVPF